MLLVPQTGWAVSFTIDNLNYKSISSDEVKIEQSPSAGGDIVIPNAVTYDGKTYKVTSMERTFKDNVLVNYRLTPIAYMVFSVSQHHVSGFPSYIPMDGVLTT